MYGSLTDHRRRLQRHRRAATPGNLGAWQRAEASRTYPGWSANSAGPSGQVSKHLGVLRKVGLVDVVRKGKHRMYSLNGQELRPVYDWVKEYERFWEHQLQRIKDRAERIERESKRKQPPPPR